jgi:peptide/nickel transport system substrate-binding protein
VKFTFDYLAKHKVGAHWVAIKVIKEVKLIDDYTVRLILHEPFAPLFVYTLQNTYIIPEHIWKDVPEKTKVEQPDLWAPANEGKFIGSGYLKFEYWRKGDEYKFSVNKSHWTRPAYDAQILKIITTPEAMLGRLKIGEIEAAVVYPWEPSALKKLCDENPHLTLDLEPTVGFYELSLNTAKKPFSDVRVRQALAGVIDRKMIAKEMYSGFAIRAVTPIQPMLKPWFNQNVIRWEEKLGTIERTKEWLAKGGYEWDSKGRIYYPKGVTNEGQDNYQIVVEPE